MGINRLANDKSYHQYIGSLIPLITAIQAGDSDLKTLRKKLGLANSCGMCVSDAREILTAESDRLAEQAMMVEIVDAGQKAA